MLKSDPLYFFIYFFLDGNPRLPFSVDNPRLDKILGFNRDEPEELDQNDELDRDEKLVRHEKFDRPDVSDRKKIIDQPQQEIRIEDNGLFNIY